MGDAEMKRQEFELPVPPEYLQLQVRQVEVTPEVTEGRQFAIRRALLDSFPGSESSPDGSGPTSTLHPRGNALPRRFRPRTFRGWRATGPLFFQPRWNPRPE